MPGVGRTPKPMLATGLMRERGIALIAVLWITVLLTVIASGFAFSMRGGALAARNTMSAAQARAAADGAVERVSFELLRPRNSPDAWLPDGRIRTWTDGEIAITATAVDEAARIDVNLAADPLLKGLLENVGGLDPDASARVLDAILDWRDADELRRPNGAEADDYRAAGLKYVPTNTRFESIGELQRVMGVTPGLMSRIARDQSGDGAPRLAARPAGHDARSRRRVHRKQKRSAREPAAGPAASSGARIPVRSHAGVADPRRSRNA